MRRSPGLPAALLIVLVLAGAVVALIVAVVASRAPSPPGVPGWRLVIDDRFDSGGVPRHWGRYDGPYGSGPENCARPDHATVRGGSLQMVLAHRQDGDCGPGWYSAGMMLAERYGSVDQRISVRFRIAGSGVRGHRIIPMRWPSPGIWPDDGEEDFCESSSYDGCATFLHSADERESRYYRADLTEWHVMTFERRDFTVRAYVDGSRRWTYRGDPTTLPPSVKRPVLQQECRSEGCPRGATGREVILIDWIRVWNPA